MVMPFLQDVFGPCACEPAENWLRDYRKPASVDEVNLAWDMRPRCYRWRCREDGALPENLVRRYVPAKPAKPAETQAAGAS